MRAATARTRQNWRVRSADNLRTRYAARSHGAAASTVELRQCKVEAIEARAGESPTKFELELRFASSNGIERARASKVLMATGVRDEMPPVDGLLVVEQTAQTSVAGAYAAGGATTFYQQLTSAAMSGAFAATNINVTLIKENLAAQDGAAATGDND